MYTAIKLYSLSFSNILLYRKLYIFSFNEMLLHELKTAMLLKLKAIYNFTIEFDKICQLIILFDSATTIVISLKCVN